MKTLARRLTVVTVTALLISACAAPHEDLVSRTPQSIAFSKALAKQYQVETRDEVFFDFNSTSLSRDSRRSLDRQANWMKKHPDAIFSVTGHADAVGSNKYNYNLAMNRARVVVAYLISRGVSHSQLFGVVSMGEDDLKVATARREHLNRRVLLEVMGMLKAPVIYAVTKDGRLVVVGPDKAVNSHENVCGGRGGIDVCASAALLGLMNLDAQASVSRKLRTELTVSGRLNKLSSLSGSVTAGVKGTVSGVGGAVAGVSADLGEALDGLGGSGGGTGHSAGASEDSGGDTGGGLGGLL